MRHDWRMTRPQPADCPPWCTVDHAEQIEDDIREHYRDVVVADDLDAFGQPVAVVTIGCIDNLDTGRRSPVTLTVPRTEGLDADEARRLALAILDGTDYLAASP
jgi:hypothetical protein